MGAKSVIRDVGRVLDMPYGDVDRIAKMVPNELNITLEDALGKSKDLREAREKDARVAELLKIAMDLEGLARHAGTHAAGVVIAGKSLDEYVPLYSSENGVSTQFTMTTIEELGLLKMDFLGLRNLTVIQDVLLQIKANHGVDVDFANMKYDDPKVFELIASGNTMGVFQLESSGMTDFMMRLRPSNFEDIVAGISLYRPGPMDSIPTYIRNKKKPDGVKYDHETLVPILDVTYGCMVYQEQVMQIVRDLAGYDYGRSDEVRRAMSKKKQDVLLRERDHFVNGLEDPDGKRSVPGCVGNGIPARVANEIFDKMVSFASYAFNKSHAAAYAVVAYETAWLKTYYPTEFMAGLMSSFMSADSSQIAKYIRNSKDMGIEVLQPDILESEKKFSVKDGKIRYGLLGVKNVGSGAIDAMIEARESAKLVSLYTFLKTVDVDRINKSAVESLIKAGAFDCFDKNRARHMSVYETWMDQLKKEKHSAQPGQLSLLDMNPEAMKPMERVYELPNVCDFPDQQKLNWEKEMLGIYLSGHPLDSSADILKLAANITSDELIHNEDHPEVKDNMSVLIGGVVSSIKTFVTKKNDTMAFVTIEDFYGAVEVVVFSDSYEKYKDAITEDNIVVVRGKLNFKEEGEIPKILAYKITPISVVEEYYRNQSERKAVGA
jgi:DNA polymerase-3 subunit alpha